MKRTQMRDTIKDIKYFNTFINEEQARVKKFSDKLKNGEVKEDRIFPVKSKMHDLKLGILIAGYSKGDELSILEKEYQGLIDDWEEVWEPEYYNKNLKMISLGILFQADSAFAQKVKNVCGEYTFYAPENVSLSEAHANLITGAKIPEEKTRILRNVIGDKLSEEGKTVAIGACVYYKDCALRVDSMREGVVTRVEVIKNL